GPVSRPRTDDGGLLLQPAGRRAARHGRPAEAYMSAAPALSVKDLSVEFRTRNGVVRALEQVSLEVGRGEMVGVVGESGSGKSVTAYTVMGILDPAGRVTAGSAMFGGLDMLNA